MINFAALLDGPIYGAIGKPARLTPADSPGAVDITAIDLTKGIAVDTHVGAQTIGVQSVAAAAKVRLSELAAKGVDLASLKEATIVLNVGASSEKTWRIHSVQPAPGPEGEDAGELYLFLTKPRA